MDGSWIAFVGSVLALLGTIAVSVVNRRTLIHTSQLQMQQARLSVNASSSLALMTQQAERSAAFFSAIEQLDRLTQDPQFEMEKIRVIAEKVNIESAVLQPFLNRELAYTVMCLARSYDQLASAESVEAVRTATATMKAKRSEFLTGYFENRQSLMDAARPAM